jgi:hypothetical protein
MQENYNTGEKEKIQAEVFVHTILAVFDRNNCL